MKIKIKKIYPDSIIPSYQREGDAAMDIYSYDSSTLSPGEGKSFRTGIAVEIPPGFAMFVWGRSGLAFKYGLTCLGGLIDPNYRGEVGIYLLNTSQKEYVVEKGHRIAQFAIQKVEQVDLEEVSQLSDTSRGDSWKGSSGY